MPERVAQSKQGLLTTSGREQEAKRGGKEGVQIHLWLESGKMWYNRRLNSKYYNETHLAATLFVTQSSIGIVRFVVVLAPSRNQAVIKARKELGIKGFCAVNGKNAEGKALYAKAKAIYAAAWEVQVLAVWACVVVHGALNLPLNLLLQQIELSLYSSFRWATTRLAAVRDLQWKNCGKVLRFSFFIWYSVNIQ